jgi:hypothetical protein
MTCSVCGAAHHTWRDLSRWGDLERQAHFVGDPEGHGFPDVDRIAYQISRAGWLSWRITEAAIRVGETRAAGI